MKSRRVQFRLRAAAVLFPAFLMKFYREIDENVDRLFAPYGDKQLAAILEFFVRMNSAPRPRTPPRGSEKQRQVGATKRAASTSREHK
jgi:hypothetical protein